MGQNIHKNKDEKNNGETKKIVRIDRHRTDTDKKGWLGFFEIFLRKYKTLSFILLLIPVILLCLGVLSMALAPAIAITMTAHNVLKGYNLISYSLGLGMTMSLSFLIFGLTLLFVAPAANFLLPLKVKPWRGNWRSIETIPWYVHNALVYIVRYMFLDFITPSPLINMFYKLMGMKIGKGVIINTSNISDPCLIEIEDYVTIGGSVHILAHYGQKGYLILSPVKIGRGANIGLKASIMGGAQIGAEATIKPHAVVLPKTKVGDGEVFG